MRASRFKRALATAASGALVLTLLPGAAFAQTVGYEEVCDGAGMAGFDDLGSTHADAISCMNAYGVIQGQTADTYGTQADITRQAFATLVARFALTAVPGLTIPDGDDPFLDVVSATHGPNVNALWNLGIIDGTTATTFSPNASLTRGQAASILFDAHVALGVSLPAVNESPFTDLGNTHGPAVEALYQAGIIAGTSETTFGYSEPITRGQIAQLLARSAQLLLDEGIWEGSLAVTNSTFMVSPSTLQNVTIADPDDTSDDLVFTVSNAVPNAEHQLALVAAADIMVDADGVYSFAETAQEADLTLASADITVVNGAPIGAGADATASITPSGTSFDFRVDPDVDETFWVVVYFDADSSGSLTTDVDGLPVAAEPFGIGGPVNADPAEAAANASYTASTITELDTDANKIVTDAGNTFFYDDNDTYTIDGNQANFAGFELAVNVNDTITVTDYQQDATLNSTFALVNNVPDAPTLTATTPSQQTVTFTFSNIVADATVTAYYTEDAATNDTASPTLNTSTFASASFTEDGDTNVDDYQVTVTGLDASTSYQFYFVQEDASGESDASAGAEATTDADAIPTATTVVQNDINDGVGSTNEILVTFSEAVTVNDASGITLATGDGFTINGVSAVAANDAGDRWVVTLDQTLNDASVGNQPTYEASIAAATVTDSTGNENVAQTAFDSFLY